MSLGADSLQKDNSSESDSEVKLLYAFIVML